MKKNPAIAYILMTIIILGLFVGMTFGGSSKAAKAERLRSHICFSVILTDTVFQRILVVQDTDEEDPEQEDFVIDTIPFQIFIQVCPVHERRAPLIKLDSAVVN